VDLRFLSLLFLLFEVPLPAVDGATEGLGAGLVTSTEADPILGRVYADMDLKLEDCLGCFAFGPDG